MSQTRKFATAAAVAVIGTGAFASGASAAISGGAYTGTQTTAHTFQASGLNVVANNATFVGSATGGNSTDFRPTYSDIKATVAGVSYKARITTTSDWRISQPVPSALSGGTFSGSVAVLAPASGNAVTIDVVNQAYTTGGVITGSPATLARVTVNATGNSNLTTVRATPGPPSVLTANVTGITYQSVAGFPLSGAITSGSTGTYTGTVSIPGVTVTANP